MKNKIELKRSDWNKIVSDHDHKSEFYYCASRGGYHKSFTFENGYTVSVVEHSFSYGLELAIIHPDGKIKSHTHVKDSYRGGGIIGWNSIDSCNSVIHTIGLIRKYRKAS